MLISDCKKEKTYYFWAIKDYIPRLHIMLRVSTLISVISSITGLSNKLGVTLDFLFSKVTILRASLI